MTLGTFSCSNSSFFVWRGFCANDKGLNSCRLHPYLQTYTWAEVNDIDKHQAYSNVATIASVNCYIVRAPLGL
jgi:hypothetical protein